MVDLDSFAVGAMSSLVGWTIFIFIIFYPKINGLKKHFEGKEKYYMEKIDGLIAYFKEKEKTYMTKIDNILEGKDEAFNKVLDDKLPLIVEKIKAEIPDIKEVLKTELPTVVDALIAKFAGPPDEKMVLALKNISQGAYYSMMSNPEIKKNIQDHINGYMTGVIHQIENRIGFSEQDIKELKEFVAWAKTMKDKFGGKEGGATDPFQAMIQSMMGGGGGGMGFPM